MNRQKTNLKALALAVLATALGTTAFGNIIFYSGNLRTSATITACGSGCALTAGDSDATWAQWAAVAFPFTLATPTVVTSTTFGFGGGTSATGPSVSPGGFEPYLSLFGAGGNFITSTFLGTTCPPGAGVVSGNCFDVQLNAGTLAAGTYTLLLSVYENMSLAENNGSGTLSDGMTGLGNLSPNENLQYALDLSLGGPAQIPEPASAWLLLAGAGLVGAFSAKRRS